MALIRKSILNAKEIQRMIIKWNIRSGGMSASESDNKSNFNCILCSKGFVRKENDPNLSTNESHSRPLSRSILSFLYLDFRFKRISSEKSISRDDRVFSRFCSTICRGLRLKDRSLSDQWLTIIRSKINGNKSETEKQKVYSR